MHLLMSEVVSLGFIMDDSALEEVLGAAFGGVKKMLNGNENLFNGIMDAC